MNSELIANVLIHKKCVFFRPEDPYVWASGIKSPIYCDNRLLISDVDSRNLITNTFVEYLRSIDVDIIAGTATAGIPWAAWIADRLNLPLVYVRASNKEHGRQNSIEGKIESGDKAVVIEDLISTGQSSVQAALKLREAGFKVNSVLSIFSYNFEDSKKYFHEHGLEYHSLCNFEILAKVAFDNKIVNEQHLNQILEWRKRVRFHEVT